MSIVLPGKFNYKMVLNKMHLFFLELNKRYNIPWLSAFNYEFIHTIRLKLGHAGMIDLKEYFLKTFVNKPRLEPILLQISFKMEYYQAISTIQSIYKYRQFNPMKYDEALLDALQKLSAINNSNPDIEG